ncbi:MAG: radical SAM protein [Deltaproteobacteria bacterium]|nr:MAG: radical SAM protein [Deltaproteobacteria bacterium]
MHLAGLTEQALMESGVRKAHARALVAWFAGRAARPRAADAYETELPRSEAVHDPDGTVRFAVHLDGRTVVETVLIEHATRRTVCVSSQAGCARGCVFCETGRLGLVRNLTAAEIVSQYAIVARHLGERPRNVVFMGMGEPLDNLEEVLKAIDVLREPAGFAVPERHITVSTVGIVPKMTELYARTKAHAVAGRAQMAARTTARRDRLRTAHRIAAVDVDRRSQRFANRRRRAGALLRRARRAGESDSFESRTGSGAARAAARSLPRVPEVAGRRGRADALAHAARPASRRGLRAAGRTEAPAEG